MNHISSMVLRGHAHAYIVGASGSSLHECQKLNLPCWDVSFENGNGTQTKFKLILSLLKSGYTVHLSDINTAYQGSIQDAYSKFGNADLVVKQNIDSSFQVQSDNAFIKSNSRTIRLFESLSDNTNNEGLFESIRRTSSDKWAACFDEQQCSNISDKDQASVAFYLNPMQCTPSLYLLVPACYEINNKKMTIVNPSAWVIRECVDQAKECSLQQTIPKNWSRGKTDNGSSSFAISWTPSYLADISVKKLLEAPWLAPKRQKIFPWQGLHNNLEGLLKAQAKEGRISITYYNKKFWKIATNCLHSMVKYGKSPNHMIASLDSETMENCMDLNLPCFNGSMLTWKNFDEGYTWTEIHWLKPILTSRVLSLGYTIHFGDTDITYIRDIWGSYSALQNRTGVDLIATDDQPYSPLNTGNVYALPTYRTKALYHNYVTLGMERPTANDQYLFHEFQHKNFKICKTRAACTEIRKVHSKELMASIFILPTPHSGCWSDGLENPADFEEYMCKSHAENFLYEHAATSKWFLMKDCDKEFDCPMVPVSWLGEKHKFLPCGPEKTEEREKLEKEKEEREKKEREAREKKEREEKEKKERENKESKDN
ncbi:hypothetical protein BC829DRAFT_398796 [Chytridium lagenaria]|nr:hypothetical protein BC829DRAFT_398796 [Chytridium lagenaria]